MPRIGQNPLKWIEIDQKPSRITVMTIVYIPELDGYWKESLDVLKLCLQSLWQNTNQSFDLMVFDNGSCDAVRDFLQEEKLAGRIQFLIFSTYNLRKLGALNFMFSCAPGEIVSYFDSDVYLRPDWLDATLLVMDAFPEAGQVSALPTADKANLFCSSTYEAINNNLSLVVIQGENLIPEKFIHAHYSSIGKTREIYFENITERKDMKITRSNVSAFVSAQDFQFTTRRDVIQKILPLDVLSPEEYYDPIYSPVFESRINNLGYWRLSTEDYLIHHIGNKLPSKEDEDLWVYGADDSNLHSSHTQARFTQSKYRKFTKWLYQNQYFRRLLKKINSLTYSMLYKNSHA